MILTLRRYQKKALAWMRKRTFGALCAEPGLGKTLITLELLRNLFKEGAARKVLLISTIRIIHNVWPSEAAKFGYMFKMSIVHGTAAQRDKALLTNADIYLINFENIQWLVEQNIMSQFDVLIVDELTFLKNSQSKRFKALKPHLIKFRYRFGLTGTPIPKDLTDLFGQLYILDPTGAVLGRNITHFRNLYYVKGFMDWDWALRQGADVEIRRAVAPHMHAIPTEGNLELSGRLENDIIVKLPQAARDFYTEFERELIAAFDGNELTVGTIGAATMKLRQIGNGGVYLPDGTTKEIHTAKIDALLELVEELNGSPALIVYDFKHDLARLLNALGKDAPHIGSGVNPKTAGKLIAKWNAGDLKYLLVHPASVGHGVNMQHGPGHTIIWVSLTYNYDLYEQMVKRIDRSGQKSTVIVHHLVAENSMDVVMLEVLRSRARQQSEFIATMTKGVFAGPSAGDASDKIFYERLKSGIERNRL